MSIVIHALVIFIGYTSTPLLPSAHPTQDITPLQLSFVKPTTASTNVTMQSQPQQASSTPDKTMQNTHLRNQTKLVTQGKTAVNSNSVAPSKASTKQHTNQQLFITGKFVNFLNSTAQSQSPQSLAEATQSLLDQQRRLDQQQQRELLAQEKARIVTQRLNLALSEHFRYPRLAQRNGWQGMVKLGLRIEPNGQLSRIRVVSTSGFPVLDQAALETLYRISMLQGVDRWLHGTYFDTVLPVEYKLLGG
ncbi:energy transducer TonB [Kaarinaea lacus]